LTALINAIEPVEAGFVQKDHASCLLCFAQFGDILSADSVKEILVVFEESQSMHNRSCIASNLLIAIDQFGIAIRYGGIDIRPFAGQFEENSTSTNEWLVIMVELRRKELTVCRQKL
jgi:hypothetical protein